MKTIFLFLLAIALFTSCNKNGSEIVESPIIGNWSFSIENTLTDEGYNQYPNYLYNRVDKIENPKNLDKKEVNSLFVKVFKEGNEYIEKRWNQNTLAPLPDVKGTWSLNKKVLTLDTPTRAFIASRREKVDVMNHSKTYSYAVTEITNKTLKLQRRDDYSGLYRRILTLSESVSCDGNMEDWAATPIGHKACGGPTHYIPYNKKMEGLDEFLRMVKEYTDLEKESQKKSNTVSDCSVVEAPSKIECSEGKPLMIK